MNRYRKLIAALIGFGVLVAIKYYDIRIPGVEALWLDMVVSAAGAFGVYQVRNEA